MKGIEIEHTYGSQYSPNQLVDNQNKEEVGNSPELEAVAEEEVPQSAKKGPSWKSNYNMSMFSDLLRQWFSDDEDSDFQH